MSLGARVCIFLIGLCIVVGTASAIVAVSTDDPPHPTSSAPSAGPVLVSTGTLPISDPNAPPAVASAAAPAGSIVIDGTGGAGAPAPTPATTDSATPTPVAQGTAALAGGAPKKPAKPPPPAAVRSAAPPPNPYATPAPASPKPGALPGTRK